MPKPLIFNLAKSKYLFALLWLGNTGAASVLLFLPIPLYGKGIGIIACGISLFLSCSKLTRWHQLVWQGQQGWQLIDKAGIAYPVTLRGDSIRTRWIVILNFCCQHTRKFSSLVIFPDTMLPEDFRRLRVCLLR